MSPQMCSEFFSHSSTKDVRWSGSSRMFQSVRTWHTLLANVGPGRSSFREAGIATEAVATLYTAARSGSTGLCLHRYLWLSQPKSHMRPVAVTAHPPTHPCHTVAGHACAVHECWGGKSKHRGGFLGHCTPGPLCKRRPGFVTRLPSTHAGKSLPTLAVASVAAAAVCQWLCEKRIFRSMLAWWLPSAFGWTLRSRSQITALEKWASVPS